MSTEFIFVKNVYKNKSVKNVYKNKSVKNVYIQL